MNSNDATSQTFSSLPEEKIAYEIALLKLQASQLARPWWRRPSSVFPSLVAIAAIAMAFITERIQAEFALINYSRAHLSQDKDRLESELKDVASQTEQVKLQQEMINQELLAIQSAKSQIEHQRQEISLDSLALYIIETRDPADLAEPTRRLAAMIGTDSSNDFAVRIDSMARSLGPSLAKQSLYLSLYMATQQTHYRTGLLSMSIHPSFSEPSNRWEFFVYHHAFWSPGDVQAILIGLTQSVLGNASDEDKISSLQSYRNFVSAYGTSSTATNSPNEFFDLICFTRDWAIENSNGSLPLLTACMSFLKELAPQVFLTMAIRQSSNTNDSSEATALDTAMNLAAGNGLVTDFSHVIYEMHKYVQLSKSVQAFESRAMEPGLMHWRANVFEFLSHAEQLKQAGLGLDDQAMNEVLQTLSSP